MDQRQKLSPVDLKGVGVGNAGAGAGHEDESVGGTQAWELQLGSIEQ